MDDKTLYQTILGLPAPWSVVEVDLKPAEEVVEVGVESAERRWPCPVCMTSCPQHDTRPRRWRHLDSCQYQTILRASVPRVRCPKHGVKQVAVPWAERGSRFTALFEVLVLRWLREASLSAVAQQFGLSWTTLDGIRQRAVRRGLKRRILEQGRELPRHLGIDETSFQKRHEYVTVVCDQEEACVVHVADGRGKEAVSEYLGAFGTEELAKVETVAMDMWRAYISAVEEWIPGAKRKICFDKFHVAQHLGQAVDKVRREEHRRFSKQGASPLSSTRYLWLRRAESLSEEGLELIASLRRVAVKTARAWALKEHCMAAWQRRGKKWARAALLAWYRWAIRSRLEPIKRVARMVKTHLEGVVNAIYHGVTNARAEGINAKIQWIKHTARGFRNRERFRTAIYFHLGGLDMTPEVLKPIRFHTS